MRLPGSWRWKPLLAWAVVVSLAVALMIHTAMQPRWPPSQPQPAVVVSHYMTPMVGGMGGGCAIGHVEARVRLDNGKVVQAATYHDGYGMVRDGALVTVQRFRVLCGTASYTILHGGPPHRAQSPTRYVRG
ncbi:hypothetical protein [Oleiagrimonas sp. C23AA]|uniref:hypothetical protein n=1 Tax=Oleiagrimonas sp. C23AA TaxID=2719047 RepID=UPI001424968B|nr:hypothetical protein [Oleiagrimonas sp. C23AA]NII10156.1 hypothetical protein [Oleiagrimonas sp. C23AA]